MAVTMCFTNCDSGICLKSLTEIDHMQQDTFMCTCATPQQLDKIIYLKVTVFGTRIVISESARDLGVVVDRELLLTAHVTAVSHAGYNHLCQL